MSSPNTLNYDSLNKSLNLSSNKLQDITKKVSKEIWDVFLEKNPNKMHREDKDKNKKLEKFSDSIKGASEWMKAEFILTVNYLIDKGLIKTDDIKSLNLRNLNKEKEADDKLKNILNELRSNVKDKETKLELEQNVSKWLLSLRKQSDSAENLRAKNKELWDENSYLKSELDALDAVSEVSERAVLKRWSKYKMIRIWNSIKNINDSSLDPETKARKVLWQANSFAIFGSWKRFDWVYNKLPLKFDINKEYTKTVDKLENAMKESTDDWEKVAIRYIMRQVNKSYKEYMEATTISEEKRKDNMREINRLMVA